jgi:hypothetical protein
LRPGPDPQNTHTLGCNFIDPIRFLVFSSILTGSRAL